MSSSLVVRVTNGEEFISFWKFELLILQFSCYGTYSSFTKISPSSNPWNRGRTRSDQHRNMHTYILYSIYLAYCHSSNSLFGPQIITYCTFVWSMPIDLNRSDINVFLHWSSNLLKVSSSRGCSILGNILTSIYIYIYIDVLLVALFLKVYLVPTFIPSALLYCCCHWSCQNGCECSPVLELKFASIDASFWGG